MGQKLVVHPKCLMLKLKFSWADLSKTAGFMHVCVCVFNRSLCMFYLIQTDVTQIDIMSLFYITVSSPAALTEAAIAYLVFAGVDEDLCSQFV